MNASSCVLVSCQSGMRRIQLAQFRWRDPTGSGEVVRGRDPEGGSLYWAGRLLSSMVHPDCMDGGLDIATPISQASSRGSEALAGPGVHSEPVGCLRCSSATARKFLHLSPRLLAQRMHFPLNAACPNLSKPPGILLGRNSTLKA